MIEGMCTVILAVALWFVLPNRVDDCKWLSAEEKTAIWERKSTGTAADPLCRKFEWHYLTECLRDYKVLIPTWLAMVSIFQRCDARLTSGFEHRRLRVRGSSTYQIRTRADTQICIPIPDHSDPNGLQSAKRSAPHCPSVSRIFH